MTFQTKEAALAALEITRSAWLDRARSVAKAIGCSGKTVTVDDVRDICPPPSDIDPRVMGALFRDAEWEPLGWVASKRVECHRRPIREFRLRG